jgi:hypothetical protein
MLSQPSQPYSEKLYDQNLRGITFYMTIPFENLLF